MGLRRASGRCLEVAIGTGRNLPDYDAAVQLVGLDLSPNMLDVARARAGAIRRPVAL